MADFTRRSFLKSMIAAPFIAAVAPYITPTPIIASDPIISPPMMGALTVDDFSERYLRPAMQEFANRYVKGEINEYRTG